MSPDHAVKIRVLPPGVSGDDLRRRHKNEMSRAFWLSKKGVWYVVNPKTGCFDWLLGKSGGQANKAGYGVVSIGGSRRSAHRVAYILLRGAIPKDLCIDHICRNRACVNPSHMQLTAPGVNVLLGEGPSAQRLGASHCVNGHEYTPENTGYRPNGWRKCLNCLKRRRDQPKTP